MMNKAKELQVENNMSDCKIHAENQEVFTDMICYIRGADISDYHQEVVRRDLTEMIISAQERKETIEHVIGGDFKEFCDQVIASLPPKTISEKLIEYCDILCMGLAVLGAISIGFSNDLYRIIEGILSDQPVSYTLDITLSTMIFIVIIFFASIVIVQSITKHVFKKQGTHHQILKGSLLGAITMIVFILIVRFGNAVMFSVNIFLAIGVVTALYVSHKLLSQL